MALENDDLPKVPDKQQGTTASGVAIKILDEKPPKPMKEKTNLEELDEIELETLLKETITYKSPRDRDCRSSLFNKLLVSAEDSIRKDSALNASGSEAVRHRNPQAATSRRSRYHHHRAGTNHTLYSAGHHAGDGKHGGGAGGSRDCGGEGGDGGSIAEKGGLGGSLNNLTVEDLYESISQHLQQRPEKSVSARQRTGGSLPCNVNAGLITPCETPLFATDRKSSTNPFNTTNTQQNYTITTTTSTAATASATVTTTTSCLTNTSTPSTGSSSSIIYGLSSSNNTSVESAPGTDAALPLHQYSVASSSNNDSSSYLSAITSGGGREGSGSKECCVIEVELEEEETGASGGGFTGSNTADMIGIKPSNQSTNPSKPSTSPPSQDQTSLFNNNNNPTTSTILSASNNPLLDCAAYNIPHIDDDDIVEEQAYQQRQQYQHKLNSYPLKPAQSTDVDQDVVRGDEFGVGTELQPMGKSTATTLSDCSGSAAMADVKYNCVDKQQQRDMDHVERRPLRLCDIDLNAVVENANRARAVGRVTGGGGPMKIIGQGPQIKHSTADSLHKQLLSSSLNPMTHTARPTSLEDPAITLPTTTTTSLHHLPSLSHHHSAQQPHHQHTGAVRIPSLSSPTMLNLNHATRRMHHERQQLDGEDGGGADGEMVIGVPSTLTGTMERESGERVNSKNYFSERTIHVGDVVESPASYRHSDQENSSNCEVNKGYGLMAAKKTDDNGNHVTTKSRKKMKPPEVRVLAHQVEGHRNDIAIGDIDKAMAYICGNGDNASSGNVAKSTKTAKSSVKLQQHRASVSGTNNRTGGKSVDAEHHSHSRRHQNHHGQQIQHNHPQNQQTNDKKLHRANSLEEMPTTTLEEFHENESKHKQNSANNNKQVSANKVSTIDLSAKKTATIITSDMVSVNNNPANSTVSVETTSSAPPQTVGVVNNNVTTNNRGRGVLRATKSNAEKSGGSRSGGSANRGSVTRASGGGSSSSGGQGTGVSLQPRRSWTNADPSPLQAIQHSATSTASAENLETDFTLVNSKKKKGKKQQQRRNSVGSRTPMNINTTQSPPSQQQQQQRNNNNNRHYNNSDHASQNTNNSSCGAANAGSIVVNLATLVQSSVAASAASVPHSDKSNGDCSSSDGDSVHSLPIDAFTGTRQQTVSSPPNLTSYASITKNNVATQQPIVIPAPPPPTTIQSTPKWTTTTPNTTTTITTTMLTSNNVVSTTNNTTTATLVHPENVVVAVQVKVVTNRSQEQQTDDIPPTLLIEANSGNLVTPQCVQSGAAVVQTELPPVVVESGNTPMMRGEAEASSQSVSTSDAPSLNEMQHWPSINNNNNKTDQSAISPHDITTSAHSKPPTTAAVVTATSGNTAIPNNNTETIATWPSLKHKQTQNACNIPVVSAANMDAKDEVKIVPNSERVVVRATSVNKHQQLHNNNNSVASVKQAPLRAERIIVSDLHNKLNSSSRHEKQLGGGVGIAQAHQQGGGIIVQNHLGPPLSQQTVLHPVLITQQHQHAPQSIIPLLPNTKIPPPNLIDHTTPPPPNFIPNVNHISPPQRYQPIIVNQINPQQNSVVYSQPVQLPVNIPDVQMIEHQLQLQHNNNNNITAKNSYNQQTIPASEYKVGYSNKQQQQRVDADFAKRPAVVIMRGGNSNDLNNVNSPLGGDANLMADDCELTFGFDVNEELLSLHADDDDHDGSASADYSGTVDDTTVLPISSCVAKDVSMMFVSRFVGPECCAVQSEFNYEKIVDFVENAWNEAVSEASDGKCNFYQDL